MTHNTLENLGETIGDRYKRCGFLNSVQHIDIYGKYRSNYVERKLKLDAPLVTSVSNCSPKFTERSSDPVEKVLEDKLHKLSVTTRVCALYPGNDILSKKSKLRQLSNSNVLRTGLFR